MTTALPSALVPEQGTACDVVPSARQIELKLEAPLNLLRADGKQPFAYDALSKFEKPRLREHFSATHQNLNSRGQGSKVGSEHLFPESTRAVTLHFAGGGNMDQKHTIAQRIAEAIFGGSGSSSAAESGQQILNLQIKLPSSSILDVVCTNSTDVNRLRLEIARQLIRCPKSVVILHDVEQLQNPHWEGGERKGTSSSGDFGSSRDRFGSAGGLIALERFFEDEEVEVAGVGAFGSGGVDMRQAVFIITSEIGKEDLRRKGVTHRDYSTRTSEEVIEVIKQSTRKWASSRPALGGRLSNSQVPFV